MNHLANMNEMFSKIGQPLYSDEFLAQLLAWFWYEGTQYVEVTEAPLYDVLMIAQRKYKNYVENGDDASEQFIKKYTTYCKEIGKNSKEAWVLSLKKRYNLD